MACATGNVAVTPCICDNRSPYPNGSCPDAGTRGSFNGMPGTGCSCSCSPQGVYNDGGTAYTASQWVTTASPANQSVGVAAANTLTVCAYNNAANVAAGNTNLLVDCECNCH